MTALLLFCGAVVGFLFGLAVCYPAARWLSKLDSVWLEVREK